MRIAGQAHLEHRDAPLGGALEVGVVDWSKGTSKEYASHVTPAATPEDANVSTSKIKGSDQHYLAIDLDMPTQLYPSSTPGHHHLYVQKAMTFAQLVDVLSALARAGLIESGYASAAIDQGHTTLRLPWVRKKKGRARPAGQPVTEGAF